MKTNDLKKGTQVQLLNGWYATLMDNKKGNIRLAEVRGVYTEIGSIYSHDIMQYQDQDENWLPVEYTESQLKCRKMNRALFGE